MLDALAHRAEERVKVGPAEVGARREARDGIERARVGRVVDGEIGKHGGRDVLRQVEADREEVGVRLNLRTESRKQLGC